MKFTAYQPHANPLDKANYPLLNKVFLFMTALLVGVFAFFGVHTLFWLVRSIYLFLHDSKAFREAKVQVAHRRRALHPLHAVRALPAPPGGDELPAAGHHRACR